jgi:L,D-peptidoglycan transpeptidase YkuD (ErfK/YbiS/YcfS/YnhG family)
MKLVSTGNRGARERRCRDLIVWALSPCASRGRLEIGGRHLPCAFGRRGRTTRKREGDGATPVGAFRLRQVFYRADRVRRPRTGLPIRVIRRADGWCDDDLDRNYNRHVRLPYPARTEVMWREDHLYDLVVVLDHNTRPRLRGRGSAIFIHVAQPGYAATAGCIALARRDLIELLRLVGPHSSLRVAPQPWR